MSRSSTTSSYRSWKTVFRCRLRVVLQAGHQLAVRAGDAVGRLEQPLAVRVFADGEQDLAHGPLDPRHVHAACVI